MKQFAAKSREASQLRHRKFSLVRKFNLPENLVGGSFGPTRRRCGKTNCHCVEGKGHVMWSISSSYQGKRRVERVPLEWTEDIEQAVLNTQVYLDALKEVMAINLELLAQTRNQYQAKKKNGKLKRR